MRSHNRVDDVILEISTDQSSVQWLATLSSFRPALPTVRQHQFRCRCLTRRRRYSTFIPTKLAGQASIDLSVRSAHDVIRSRIRMTSYRRSRLRYHGLKVTATTYACVNEFNHLEFVLRACASSCPRMRETKKRFGITRIRTLDLEH